MPASGRSRREWGWHRLADEWAARTLLAPGSSLAAADLVLQRAVVRRYASGTARRFSLTAGLTLPRRAFLPPPHVDSAVLVIRRRK